MRGGGDGQILDMDMTVKDSVLGVGVVGTGVVGGEKLIRENNSNAFEFGDEKGCCCPRLLLFMIFYCWDLDLLLF